ncbi:unnamed protein product [Allacma fusca]|uniref:BED-type domain-containing protein n=1 Tax=Allacma fusca TaxID=39272 RepID=A0A8J2JUK1_9HEXA|nr:unnamed protein product [Allacma fusca]
MDVVEILSSEELSLDDEIPSNLDILKQRKSGIYQQFVWNEEKKKFQCNHCKNFFVQKCKSTGNLWKHYNRCAKPLINNPRHNHNDNTSGRITKFFKPQLEGFDKDELENKLLDFVIMTDQPFSILEDPSFIAFAVYGRPIDGLFSSTTLKRRLLQRYEPYEVVVRSEKQLGNFKLEESEWKLISEIVAFLKGKSDLPQEIRNAAEAAAAVGFWDEHYKPQIDSQSEANTLEGDILASQMKRKRLSKHDEFRQYLALPPVEKVPNNDILCWWKVCELLFV